MPAFTLKENGMYTILGLSSETKPVNDIRVKDGAMYIELDTKKMYIFYSGTWYFFSSSDGGSAGTTDHSALINRELSNQHPISAIDGLSDILNNKENKKGPWILKGTITTDTKANRVSVDLTGCTELKIVGTTSGTGTSSFQFNGLYGVLFAECVANTNNRIFWYESKTNEDGTGLMASHYRVGPVNYYADYGRCYDWKIPVSFFTDFSLTNPEVVTACDIKIYAR